MKREFEAADDGGDYRLTNNEVPKNKEPQGIDREFADAPGAPSLPPQLTAKVGTGSPTKTVDPKQPAERLEIDLDLEDDLTLGIKINDKLIVEGFKKMGPQEYKFTIGDQIIGVNGRSPRSGAHFHKLLQKIGPHCRVSLARPTLVSRAHQYRLNKHGLTETTIRDNFPDDQFLVAHIMYKPGVHLGLSVNSFDGVVVICRVDKNSLADRRFEVGDIVIDVDGEQVRDKHEFRNYMMDAVDRNSYASVLLQRPLSPKSVRIAKIAIGQAQKDPLDPPLPHDAMIIGRREMQRFKVQETTGKIGIKPVLNETPKGGQHLAISEEKPIEHIIQSDIPDGKRLSPCPTRAQLHARLKARLAKKTKKPNAASKPEIVGSLVNSVDMNNNNCDAVAPPHVSPVSAPSPETKPKESDSFIRRAQDSWREKKSRIFSKKNSDSDSSSRRGRRTRKFFGNNDVKDQSSDRRNNSDKSAKNFAPKDEPSERRRKDDNRGRDDGSERRRKNDDSSKKRRRA